MARAVKLKHAEVGVIHDHLDIHLVGQRKALAKWKAAQKLSDEPAIETNVTYCRWAISFIGMLKKNATQRIGLRNAGKHSGGNVR